MSTLISGTPPSETRQKMAGLLDALNEVVIGYPQQMETILLSLLAGGHVSALGSPGTAKTVTMKFMGWAMDCMYRRVQMVPDLMPSDILGTEIFHKDSGKFKYRFGPLNPRVNLFHADEINRTPPRTQSALLEAMEEGQITVPGRNPYKLHEVFMLLATRNPIDTEGTYPLPAAQLDRFAAEIVYTRLSRELEREVARKTAFSRKGFEERHKGLITIADVPKARAEMAKVVCSDPMLSYAHDIVFATRPEACPPALNGWFKEGVSVRAVQWILRLAQARAYLWGSECITPDDVKFVVPAVLRHRLYINEERLITGATAEQAVEQLLQFVPIVKS